MIPLLGLVLLSLQAQEPTRNWPAFRGPDGSGVATASLPAEWNADPALGPWSRIRWKTPIPGLGHSSPIIWGDRLFVASAVRSAGEATLKVGLYGDGGSADDDTEQRWIVSCLDKKSGKMLWEKTAHQGLPRARRHPKATHANTTLATDGTHVAAFFGSEGLSVFDFQGETLWKKDLGVFDVGPVRTDLQWGNASSPVLFQDKLVLQGDRKQGSFLAVFGIKDGKELWRTDRDGVSSQSWATPAVVQAAERTQIVCNGWPFIAGYDLGTGKELWRLKSGGDIAVPMPVFAQGLIFVTNAHGGKAPLYAIRPEASGDLSDAAGLAWSEPRNGAYMQTPLVYEDLLYSSSDSGVLKVYDARSGKLQYAQRLGSGKTGFSSSPVAAGGKIYFADEEGAVFVIRTGPRFELLATSRFGESVLATPAISENTLYYRTRRHIVAVGD